ncbi:hypothetical protein EJB05_20004, partial [Eragrostis curvula]
MEVEGKAPVSEHGETSKAAAVHVVAGKSRAASRGLAVLDLILRIVAVIATVGSAIAMGTTNQTLPFFTQFLRFKAQYDDLPTLTYVLQYSFSPDLSLRRCVFVTSMPKARHVPTLFLVSARYFVVVNSIVAAYLVLSIPLSIVHIIRSRAKYSRLILIFFDAAMLALVTSAASAAVAIVYLAHKGNARANWFAICQQFDSFCERISASLIGSFVAVALFILLIILSAIALARR